MAETTLRQWPYAGPNDTPDVPYWQQRLAEKGEAEVQNIHDTFTVDYQDGIASGTTLSMYTRQRIGLEGTVTAHIVVALGSNTLPTNTSSNLLLVAGCVPPGFRAAHTIGNSPAVISGMGRGDAVQFQILANGDLTLRSAGATFTTLSGSTLILDVTYRWNGVL
jgi:hypothetical protein